MKYDSDVKLEVVVVVDVNDYDLETKITPVDNFKKEYLPLLEKLADAIKDNKGKWCNFASRSREILPEEMYKGTFTKDDIEILDECFLPVGDENYGFHTIYEIKIREIAEDNILYEKE